MLKHIFSSLDINILLSSFGNLFSLIVLTMGLFSPFPVLLLTDPFSLSSICFFYESKSWCERVYALEPFFIC